VYIIAELLSQRLRIIALGAIIHHDDLIIGIGNLLQRLKALYSILKPVPVEDYD
jgi:hypothetical protein